MKTTALISFSLFAFAGCMTEAGPTDPSAPADDPITEVPDISCLDPTLGGVDRTITFAGSATSPSTASYNSPTAACFPGKYVVELDGTGGKAPTPFVQYAGAAPTNSTDCANTSAYGQVFGHLPSGWVAVGGPDAAFGAWSPWGCILPHITFPQETIYDRIAVSGVAYSDTKYTIVNVTDGAN